MPDTETDNSPDGIVIADSDNVAVCLHDIEAGAAASLRSGKDTITVTAVDPIPRGHKIAVRAIGNGESVLKYGEIIGKASQDIGEGNHVHTHNVVD